MPRGKRRKELDFPWCRKWCPVIRELGENECEKECPEKFRMTKRRLPSYLRKYVAKVDRRFDLG